MLIVDRLLRRSTLLLLSQKDQFYMLIIVLHNLSQLLLYAYRRYLERLVLHFIVDRLLLNSKSNMHCIYRGQFYILNIKELSYIFNLYQFNMQRASRTTYLSQMDQFYGYHRLGILLLLCILDAQFDKFYILIVERLIHYL